MRNKIKRTQIFRYIKDHEFDITILQETHSTKNSHKIWKNEFRGNILFSDGASNARGTAILFAESFKVQDVKTQKDNEGRTLYVTFNHNGMSFKLCAIYAPNEDKPEYFANIFEQMQQADEDHIVMAGDFNVYLTENDKKGGSVSESKTRNLINTFLDESDWVDIWRSQHPETFQFTWKRSRPLIMHRLDYFLAPLSTTKAIKNCEIIANSFSDHSTVVIDLVLESSIRGPGVWKFNTSFLQNKAFVDNMNTVFETAEEKYALLNPLNKWEKIKKDMTKVATEHAYDAAKKRKKNIKVWNNKLTAAQKKLAMVNLSSDRATIHISKANAIIDEVTEKLRKESIHAANGAIMRSKARWMALAEHGSKYFFNLEKRKAKAKAMNQVYDKYGNLVTSPNKILEVQARFYEELYTSDPQIKCNIPTEPERKLSEVQKLELDKEVTMEEIQENLKEMARNKSPGTDGFQIDIYICFWLKMKNFVYDMIKYILETGSMHETARQGIISLIPKKLRNIKEIKNWRPIVLLNSDFKLVSKILASRMKKVLEHIIAKDQTGFISGRNISENLRKLIDVIDYTESANAPGIIALIDFEKAFDRVEYKSLYDIMRWFNFGERFIQWTGTLFRHFSLSTLNNGFLSEPFTPTRGLFQGNPIASSCFILIIEVLAVMIRKNKKIKGLKIGKEEILLTQFADDLGLVLDYNQQSFNQVINEFNTFQRLSGMLINYEKSTIYRIGSLKNSNARFYTTRNMNWTNEPVKVLGMMLDHDKERREKLNLDEIIKTAESTLGIWKARGLSFYGKIRIVNTLIASLFIYRLTVLHKVSEAFFDKMDKIFEDFIWNERKPKISKTIIQGLADNGGAGLVNMRLKHKALRIQWVAKIKHNETLCNIAKNFLKTELEQLVWEASMTRKQICEIFKHDNFWRDVLIDWNEHKAKLIEEIPVMQKMIWLNSDICIAGKPIFYKEFFGAGIVYIEDILNPDAKILNFDEFTQKYGAITNFVRYKGLTECIKKKWGNEIKESNENGQTIENMCKNLTSKTIYRKLCFNEDLLETKVNWINNQLNVKINVSELNALVQNIKKITISVKLRSFQYRLLMNGIITNVQLKYFKIKDTNRCTFCEESVETLKHLFYECKQVQLVWKYISRKYDMQNLAYDHILCNNYERKPGHAKNCTILIVKHYIYVTRCQMERISSKSCENYVIQYINTEEEIAKGRNKMHLHELKWK